MNKKIQPFDINKNIKPEKSSSVSQDKPQIPFQNFFDEALNGMEELKSDKLDHNFNQKPALSLDENKELLAQALNPEEIEQIFQQVQNNRNNRQQFQNNQDEDTFLNTNRIETTPFQMIIDKAVEVLESISNMEYRVNDLTEQYIEGKISLDEVSVETMKLNLAVSFITTLLSSATQSLKEVTQIAL